MKNIEDIDKDAIWVEAIDDEEDAIECPNTDCFNRGEYSDCYILGTKVCRYHTKKQGFKWLLDVRR